MQNHITNRSFTLHDENPATLKYTLGKEYKVKGLQLDLAFTKAYEANIRYGVEAVNKEFADIVAIINAANV